MSSSPGKADEGPCPRIASCVYVQDNWPQFHEHFHDIGSRDHKNMKLLGNVLQPFPLTCISLFPRSLLCISHPSLSLQNQLCGSFLCP